MEQKYEVYVLLNAQNHILALEGGVSIGVIQDISQWVKIDEGESEKYRFCQSAYLGQPLYTEDGFPRYKLEDGKPVERTDEELDADRLPMLKTQRIRKSKEDLNQYLLAHPLTWTDGEPYAITEEKQNQLMGTLIAAQLDGKKPEWNTTGGICKEWELPELTALAVAIKDRVKGLVKYQQTQEMAIKEATSLAEVGEIEVDYDTVG